MRRAVYGEQYISWIKQLILTFLSEQWMEPGPCGARGRCVLQHVAVGSGKEAELVTAHAHSLEVQSVKDHQHIKKSVTVVSIVQVR